MPSICYWGCGLSLACYRLFLICLELGVLDYSCLEAYKLYYCYQTPFPLSLIFVFISFYFIFIYNLSFVVLPIWLAKVLDVTRT